MSTITELLGHIDLLEIAGAIGKADLEGGLVVVLFAGFYAKDQRNCCEEKTGECHD